MKNEPRQKLIDEVLKRSEAKTWDEAKLEWTLDDAYYLKSDKEATCVCGHKGITYMFKLINKKTKEELFPVGRDCITKFGIDELNESLENFLQFRRLINAVKKNVKITIETETTEAFLDGCESLAVRTRLINCALLTYLYRKDAFKTKDNPYYPWTDYAVLFDIAKRKKPTSGEIARAQSMIDKIIIPFAKKYIENEEKNEKDDKKEDSDRWFFKLK